jgi:hypothetical protein
MLQAGKWSLVFTRDLFFTAKCHCDTKMLLNAGPLHFLHTCQSLPHEHRECFAYSAYFWWVSMARAHPMSEANALGVSQAKQSFWSGISHQEIAVSLAGLLKNLNQSLVRNFRGSFYSGQFIMLSPRRQGRKEKTGKVYLSVKPVISFAFFAPLRELHSLHAPRNFLTQGPEINAYLTVLRRLVTAQRGEMLAKTYKLEVPVDVSLPI